MCFARGSQKLILNIKGFPLSLMHAEIDMNCA